jgi:bifunctional UDP-N-acetylglucosamine pyrophosphorylase / glucosamine-1-phosphate N-acetyltransferase
VELRVQISDGVQRLLDKGVAMINPFMVHVAEDVDPDRIAGEGVCLYPGTRLYGAKTAILPGAQLGAEGPVVVENCQIGPRAALKGGYFKNATFLEKANFGLGAHVREGCLIEEEAGGAHTVGLKQTILFPFVTLGSLINFCDCLMAGGRSRQDHSEVGSGYIHFNFTPEADKTTASLLGDVPRGVMLNQAPIFLGGQGGIVGPVHVGFGTVVAAGSVLRHDTSEDHRLVIDVPRRSLNRPFLARRYSAVVRVVNNNIRYIANLLALAQWYSHVRRGFFEAEPMGALLYEGAIEKLEMAKAERVKRLKAMADKMPEAIMAHHENSQDPEALIKKDFHQAGEALAELLGSEAHIEAGQAERDRFLEGLTDAHNRVGGGYIEAIQQLPPEVSQVGTQWLQAMVSEVQHAAWQILPRFRPE